MVSLESPVEIMPAKGKLGILMPGLGAVSTTFIAGTLAIRNGISSPIGSLTQMGTLRLGKRTDNREVDIKDFVPITNLDDLVFGGWDIFEDNCYEAAVNAGVIDTKLLDQVKDELTSIKPMKAVFDKHFVKKLDGTYVKSVKGHRARIEALRQDIQDFKKKNNVSHIAMIGDDLINDIEGAQKVGIKGGLVRTGKFRKEILDQSKVKPDFILSSISELPNLF